MLGNTLVTEHKKRMLCFPQWWNYVSRSFEFVMKFAIGDEDLYPNVEQILILLGLKQVQIRRNVWRAFDKYWDGVTRLRFMPASP
jgi:hypothetical protein